MEDRLRDFITNFSGNELKRLTEDLPKLRVIYNPVAMLTPKHDVWLSKSYYGDHFNYIKLTCFGIKQVVKVCIKRERPKKIILTRKF